MIAEENGARFFHEQIIAVLPLSYKTEEQSLRFAMVGLRNGLLARVFTTAELPADGVVRLACEPWGRDKHGHPYPLGAQELHDLDLMAGEAFLFDGKKRAFVGVAVADFNARMRGLERMPFRRSTNRYISAQFDGVVPYAHMPWVAPEGGACAQCRNVPRTRHVGGNLDF